MPWRTRHVATTSETSGHQGVVAVKLGSAPRVVPSDRTSTRVTRRSMFSDTFSTMADWNKGTIDDFRAKGGKGVGHFGDKLLLLTHRGAKSGEGRATPLG